MKRVCLSGRTLFLLQSGRGGFTSDAGFGNTTRILDAAVDNFAAELGRQVQEQRNAVGLTADSMAQMLSLFGIPMRTEDLEKLEAGERSEIDIRLLTVLVFLLELSLNQVVIACLQQASANIASD